MLSQYKIMFQQISNFSQAISIITNTQKSPQKATGT